MAQNIGTYHIADNNQLYEPARSNNFEFVVFDVDRLLRAGVTEELAEDRDYITNAQEVIRISVNETSVPHFSLGVIEIKRGNNIVKFAGTPTFEAGSLKLNDYIGARTKDVLLAWQARAYDVNTEKVHMASNYKKDCQLIEYTPDYDQIVRIWDLKGCWISGITEGAFSNEDNSKRVVEATVQYDKAIPRMPDEVAEV